MPSVSFAELFLQHLKLNFIIDNYRFLMLLSPDDCEGERGRQVPLHGTIYETSNGGDTFPPLSPPAKSHKHQKLALDSLRFPVGLQASVLVTAMLRALINGYLGFALLQPRIKMYSKIKG